MAKEQADVTSVDPMLAGPSDQSLLMRFQRGQGDAATALYFATLIGFMRCAQQKGADLAGRVDAEDIVQSVFRTFFRRAAAGHYAVPKGDELWKLFLVIGVYKWPRHRGPPPGGQTRRSPHDLCRHGRSGPEPPQRPRRPRSLHASNGRR